MSVCRVVVELDTHNAVEVMPEELGEEGQEEGEVCTCVWVCILHLNCFFPSASFCPCLHCHHHKFFCKLSSISPTHLFPVMHYCRAQDYRWTVHLMPMDNMLSKEMNGIIWP